MSEPDETRAADADAGGVRRVERQEDGHLVLKHPQGLRALAHPARAHAFDRLYEGDALTATQLAAEVGITPSAMSYHLRELQKWGIVERVEAAEDGRERPWRAAGTGLSIASDSFTAANRVLAENWFSRYLDRLLARLDQMPGELADDAEGGLGRNTTVSYSAAWLTDAEKERLDAALAEVQRALPTDRSPRRHPDDARRYELWTFLLPDAEEGRPGPGSGTRGDA